MRNQVRASFEWSIKEEITHRHRIISDGNFINYEMGDNK